MSSCRKRDVTWESSYASGRASTHLVKQSTATMTCLFPLSVAGRLGITSIAHTEKGRLPFSAGRRYGGSLVEKDSFYRGSALRLASRQSLRMPSHKYVALTASYSCWPPG